jgi:mono/diheme cytochrome c family protein
MKRPIAWTFAWSVCLFPLIGSAQDTAIYTTSQAQQGAALYASQCAACHGAQLEGGAGPALTGSAFHQMAAVQHLTPKSLLEVVSTTMPMTAPGSLKPDQYAALVAFILQRSGYSAGDKPLSKDSANLASLDLGVDKSGAAAAAHGTPMRLASQGVYTAAQMERGKAFYNDSCNQCHGAELEGGEDAPPLAGKAFIAKWGGLPVGTLHAFIDKNMPPGNGGALGPDNEAEVVAYILSKNYFPPGPAPLTTDPARLNAIAIK